MQQIASTAQLRASLIRWSLFTIPLCLGLGLLSSAVAGSVPQNPWFAMLDKPAIYPPPIVFPVVWTALYIMMGLALAMLATARGARGRGLAIAVFAAQFVLNLAWAPVFFGLHLLTGSLVVIGLLLVTLLLTVVLAWRVRRGAAALLLPYLAWVCFASLLNLQIVQLNPGMDGVSGSGAAVRVQL